MIYDLTVKTIKEKLNITKEEAEKILDKAEAGGEILNSNLDEWLLQIEAQSGKKFV